MGGGGAGLQAEGSATATNFLFFPPWMFSVAVASKERARGGFLRPHFAQMNQLLQVLKVIVSHSD